jgi:DNA polymerase-3 subunit delta'
MTTPGLTLLSSLDQRPELMKRLQRLALEQPGGRVFLFWGPPGSGKAEAGLGLASAWLCQGSAPAEPCGGCPACRKLASSSHPDLLVLEPAAEKRKISIDQARELIRDLRFPPLEGKGRVVLIPGAERLSLEAANALLKTLEEPPPETTAILTAADPEALPPTILSRTQQLHFPAPDPERMTALLAQRLEVDSDKARLAAFLGAGVEGTPEPDLELALDLRATLINRFTRSQGSDSKAALGITALAEEVAAEGTAQLFINLSASHYRDLLLLASGGQASEIVSRDLAAQMSRLASLAPPKAWADRLEAVLEAQTALAAYANPRLTMESLLLRLGD